MANVAVELRRPRIAVGARVLAGAAATALVVALAGARYSSFKPSVRT